MDIFWVVSPINHLLSFTSSVNLTLGDSLGGTSCEFQNASRVSCASVSILGRRFGLSRLCLGGVLLWFLPHKCTFAFKFKCILLNISCYLAIFIIFIFYTFKMLTNPNSTFLYLICCNPLESNSVWSFLLLLKWFVPELFADSCELPLWLMASVGNQSV